MDNDKGPMFRLGDNPVIFGTAAAIVFVILCIVLLSLFFYFTSISELYLKPIGTFCYLVGAFLGGFLAAKKAGGKGLVYGAEVGVCYYVFMILFSLLVTPGSLSATTLLLKGLFTLVISTAGGICGLAFT